MSRSSAAGSCARAASAAPTPAGPAPTITILRASLMGCSLGTQSASLLLPARHQGVDARLRRATEKVGMRETHRESEHVETPPHQAEFWFSSLPCGPLPASGARSAL